MIYHIAQKKAWQKALRTSNYIPDSFDKDGFIHCSPLEKIPEVFNNFYKGQNGLVLLCIEESVAEQKIVWEDLYDHGYKFPHIYGKLNSDAVIKAVELNCDKDGLFIFPDLEK